MSNNDEKIYYEVRDAKNAIIEIKKSMQKMEYILKDLETRLAKLSR